MSSPATPPAWKVFIVSWYQARHTLGGNNADRLTEFDHSAATKV